MVVDGWHLGDSVDGDSILVRLDGADGSGREAEDGANKLEYPAHNNTDQPEGQKDEPYDRE